MYVVLYDILYIYKGSALHGKINAFSIDSLDLPTIFSTPVATATTGVVAPLFPSTSFSPKGSARRPPTAGWSWPQLQRRHCHGRNKWHQASSFSALSFHQRWRRHQPNTTALYHLKLMSSLMAKKCCPNIIRPTHWSRFTKGLLLVSTTYRTDSC